LLNALGGFAESILRYRVILKRFAVDAKEMDAFKINYSLKSGYQIK
jgi:hypothetical protein